MHIPSSMLQGGICPVTALVSVGGVLTAGYLGVKAKLKPTATRFGAVTGLIFAGQMMNFPIMDGTSGHLLGGVLAASLLGVPFGVLAIALVVAIQSLVFADGGVAVLGANIFNMAIVGAGVGGVLREMLRKSKLGQYGSTAAAAWLSVVLASLVVSAELAIAGEISFWRVLPAMVGTHALIGIGEAIITVGCLVCLSERSESKAAMGRYGTALLTAVVVALLLSPLASGWPDGLEWVAARHDFLHEGAPAFVGVLPDYVFPGLGEGVVATGLAGLTGVAICFFAAWLLGRALQSRNVKVGVERE
ncbi:MAG: energy-coupling factor ABC transporter permease [Sedimentisphaerales bacterium]|nr:energy-coupling factor ABC transporter permease [Sedimentisphaerales bacterium]